MIAREPQIATRVALRPLRQSDLSLVRRWRSDPIAARFCGWDHPDNAPGRIEGRYLPAIMDPEGADAWHFCIECGDRPIGLASYDHVDPHNHSCRLDVLIGEASARGRGAGSDALRRLLSLLFGPGGMHRVWLAVNAENEKALRCLRRAGFRADGTLREAERFEGRWVDLVVMSLLASEWRRHAEPVTWTITPLQAGEEPWFERLSDDAGMEPWETRQSLKEDEVLVWRANDEAAGFATLAWRDEEVELKILAVDPAFRRQGLATRILCSIHERAAKRGLKRVRLHTSNDNCAAVTLYQRVGFRIVNLTPGILETRRGYPRRGQNDIPLRDDVDMVWEIG